MDLPQDPPAANEYIIFFGVSGSGKTSFIRHLAPDGRRIPSGNEYSPDILEYPVSLGGKQVILVDTPGTDVSNDILQDVQDWMGSRGISFDSILGIIFLQPITMNRVDMTLSKQILNKFRGTGKGNLYRRVMLSTTRWSNEASIREVQEKREQLLQHQLWNPLTNQGALTQRYDGTETTAESIVQAILEAPSPDPGERASIRGPRSGFASDMKMTKTEVSPTWFKSYAKKFIIVLLGPSGSGRSSFIARALGQEVKQRVGLETLTTKITVSETRLPSGKEVVLVDVPGDQTYEAPNGSLLHLRQWVDTPPRCTCFSDNETPTISLVLFFHRMESPDIPRKTLNIAETFRQTYENKLDRVHLVTTFWDGNGTDADVTRLNDLWRDFTAAGLTVWKFGLEEVTGGESAQGILDAMTKKISEVGNLSIPVSLVSLAETSAPRASPMTTGGANLPITAHPAEMSAP